MSLGDEPVTAWAMSQSLGKHLIECGSKTAKHEKAHIEVASRCCCSSHRRDWKLKWHDDVRQAAIHNPCDEPDAVLVGCTCVPREVRTSSTEQRSLH